MASFYQKGDPSRHSLLPGSLISDGKLGSNEELDGFVLAEDAKRPVTLEHVKANLQTALEVEHSTIPPYLCALYSIKEGKNRVAYEIIKSVVLEEMLHMVMVANLINAIGGKPSIGIKQPGQPFIPSYPTQGLPGGLMKSLKINLGRFSLKSIKTFITIEHPAPEGKDLNTIGGFYHALLSDLITLEKRAKKEVGGPGTIFIGAPELQVSSQHYYGAGGRLHTVSNLEDAVQVIDEIVGQGEGVMGGQSIFATGYSEKDTTLNLFGPEVDEYAHYFRFKEVMYGRRYAPTDNAHRDSPNHGLPSGEKFEQDWDDVYPMQENPKMSNFPEGSPLFVKTYECNVAYMKLLANLNEACNGRQDKLREGIPLMYELRNKCVDLMKIPIDKRGTTAGPSFEYVDLP